MFIWQNKNLNYLYFIQTRPKNLAAPIGTFYVYLTTSRSFGAGQTIEFETVGYDAGNEYDMATGIFHAPVSGVYVFHVTIYAGSTTVSLEVHLMVGSTIAMATHGYYYPDMSGTAIVHVNAGDGVRVRMHPSYSTSITGSGLSHFAGFLLHADPVQ